jgi:concanavalin A-like lectin/glucanase superfamily protein
MRPGRWTSTIGWRALFLGVGSAGVLLTGCTPDEVQAPREVQAPQPGIEAAVAPTSGLIGEWKLDETNGTTAADTKNGFNATVQGGAAFVAGKLGNALNLNNGTAGTGGKYAQMPSNATLDNVQEGNYTISAWFFPSTIPPDATADNRHWAIVAKASPHMGLLYNASGKFLARHYLTGTVGEQATSPTSYPVGAWYHVASTVSKTTGTVKVYVNGVFQDQASFAPGTAAEEYGTTPFQIGKSGTFWAANGKVDQVRIYNRELTATEIADLFHETVSATRPLPVGISSTDAIGDGPGNDASGPQWQVLLYAANPNTIASDIDLADSKNVLLVLNMPGNKPRYRDAAGNFSMQLYTASLDRFVFGKANAEVSQATSDKIKNAMARRRIVCYIIDEPNLDNEMSPAQVAQMAAEHKARWDCLTIARVTPTLLANGWGGWTKPAGGYPKLDYGWSAYSYSQARDGTAPATVWAQERSVIASAGLNVGLMVSLNLWAGGINQVTGGQQPCWDYARNGSSGYVLGDREDQAEKATPRNCGTLPTPAPSVIASPSWIQYFTQQVANDGGFPFMISWQHATGTVSSEFNGYYTRSDFVNAFDNTIQTGQAAQAANWRTPK